MTRKEIKDKIKELNNQLTGDMMQDMELKNQIHNLQMKLDGVKPMDTKIDCEGCGS